VKKEEVLHRVKDDRNILHTAKGRKTNWTGHIFCRNGLLRQVVQGRIEGRIEVMGRSVRRRKQILYDLK
jgi:hypothetical protein